MKLRNWLMVCTLAIILVGSVSAATISYTSVYPPGNNFTYVNATSYTILGATYYPYQATNSSTPLTGSMFGTGGYGWLGSTNTSQRFNIDLGEVTRISRIYYENVHYSGSVTTAGAKNFTFWGSNTSGSFLTTTYSNDTGWTSIPTAVLNFDEHIASNTTDPKYILLNSSVTYRYYSFKVANGYGHVNNTGLRRVELQKETSWVYSTPGTYYWVCPLNVTSVSANIGAGGGSGKGAYNYMGTYYIGYGGAAGESGGYSSIATTPGSNYTIVVGAGGTESAFGAVSNAGTTSSAFGNSKAGGAGGLSLPYLENANGGNGANGFLAGGNAEDGGDASPYYGGNAGNGYSAGGGGGAANNAPVGAGKGGKGSDGIVGIYQVGYASTNVAAFSASPTTSSSGTLVSFTDESSIVDSTNLTYLWDFGDGTQSTTIGDINHVYAYYGSYTVSLTITSDSGSITETKEAYITIMDVATEINLGAQPITVQLKVVDGYSVPLVGANVRIWYDSSSLPNTTTSWLESILGVDTGIADEILDNSLVMTQNTGSDGGMTFVAFPGLGYQINILNSTIGLNHTVTLVPRDTSYTIHCPLTSQQKTPDSLTARSGTWLPWYKVNATAYRLQVNYSDTSGATTNVRFIVMYRNGTQLYNHTQAYTGGTLIDNYTVNNLPMGTELIWKYNATRSW